MQNRYFYGYKIIYDKKSGKEDFEKAEQLLISEADSGNVLAVHDLGKLYSTKKLGEKDEAKSYKYYEESFQGFTEIEPNGDFMFPYETVYQKPVDMRSYIWYRIGKMHCYGLGTQKDMIKATDYFKRSAELNNTNAKRTLALEYLSGKHLEQDIEKGLEMLTECADRGDTLSCYKLGKIYFKGEIVYKDLNTAEKYFLKASEKENQYALYSLGTLYLEKEKYNIDKTVKNFEKALQYEEIKPYAGYSLAKIMLDNNSYHDSEKAVSLLESSTAENDWASFLLGRLYLYGRDDIIKDKEKALEWLNVSAEQGNEYAQNMLDNIHSFENALITDTIFGLFVNLSRCIADDYNRKFKSNRMSVDRKLRRIIQQKKQALGLKEEYLQNQEQY